MLSCVVTASGTQPTAESTATYIVKSASAIMVGPEIVPPGRSIWEPKACRTRAPPFHTVSMLMPLAAWRHLGKLCRQQPRRVRPGSALRCCIRTLTLAPRRVARHVGTGYIDRG